MTNPSHGRRILGALCALLGGCSGDPHAAARDGGVDAPNLLVTCMPQFPGRTYYIRQGVFLPPDQGFDLDDDGDTDNAIGRLATAFDINQILNGQIGRDYTNYLFHFPDLPGPPLQDGRALDGTLYMGLDTSQQPAHDAKFDGTGSFFVNTEQFDVDCRPVGAFDRVVARGERTLELRARLLPINLPGEGTINLHDARATVTLTGEGFERSDILLGGVTSACDMSLSIRLVNMMAVSNLAIAVAVGLQPDVDLGGDGIGRFKVENGQVTICEDPSGAVLPGPACACDPRMSDGYSVALQLEGVPAWILGVLGAE